MFTSLPDNNWTTNNKCNGGIIKIGSIKSVRSVAQAEIHAKQPKNWLKHNMSGWEKQQQPMRVNGNWMKRAAN